MKHIFINAQKSTFEARRSSPYIRIESHQKLSHWTYDTERLIQTRDKRTALKILREMIGAKRTSFRSNASMISRVFEIELSGKRRKYRVKY